MQTLKGREEEDIKKLKAESEHSTGESNHEHDYDYGHHHQEERKEKEKEKEMRGLKKVVVLYKNCRKNHAANIGKYAVDGCCEFMAAGEAGSNSALLCAACGCHRNFHAKVVLQCHSQMTTTTTTTTYYCDDCSSLSTTNTPKK